MTFKLYYILSSLVLFFIFYFTYLFLSLFLFFNFIYFYLFIFGCVGSSFLCEGFLQLWRVGTTPHRGAWASHCRGLSLRSVGSRRAGSVVVVHGLSCSAACGIFLDQGSNPCPLHRQADSQPLRHEGSLLFYFLIKQNSFPFSIFCYLVLQDHLVRLEKKKPNPDFRIVDYLHYLLSMSLIAALGLLLQD